MAILNRENKEDKYFQIYDIFNEKVIRKILKEQEQDDSKESDAFDIDIDGQVIVYANGSSLVF